MEIGIELSREEILALEYAFAVIEEDQRKGRMRQVRNYETLETAGAKEAKDVVLKIWRAAKTVEKEATMGTVGQEEGVEK